MATKIYSGTSEKDGKLVHDSEAYRKWELEIPRSVGLCKNCFRSRRQGSAYCGQCQNDPPRIKIYQAEQKGFPLMKKIIGHFNLTPSELEHICFTYGDTLFFDSPLSYGLVAHELTHVMQQLHVGSDIWWEKYLKRKKFRLEQEAEAYQQQYRVLSMNDPEKAAMALTILAGDLSGKMYGNIIDFDKAVALISEQ